MPVPKYYELYTPILTVIGDGKAHIFKDIKTAVANKLGLSEADLAERLTSGQSVFDNRIGWAKTYLKKAGLVECPMRAQVRITGEGLKILKSGENISDDFLLERYPSFAEFKKTRSLNPKEKIEKTGPANMETIHVNSETPQEILDRMYQLINDQVADDVLSEIMNQTAAFFENLVVDLMKAMGYGDGFKTKNSGDGGIDGVINEDKLGFNLIYIQAKRWDIDKTIGRPEIQKFAGAMMGPPRIDQGLFITTAKFSDGAREYAQAQHIILVDGKALSELMIEYNIGVSVQKTYNIKKVDTDYFAES